MNDRSRTSKLVFIWFLAVVLIYGIWEFKIRGTVKQGGVYTKCFVSEVLGYKGGVRIEITYYFKGNKYKSLVNYSGDIIRVGDQYIIMLLPKDPTVVVFDKKRVPDCLLSVEPPPSGWVKYPVCQ